MGNVTSAILNSRDRWSFLNEDTIRCIFKCKDVTVERRSILICHYSLKTAGGVSRVVSCYPRASVLNSPITSVMDISNKTLSTRATSFITFSGLLLGEQGEDTSRLVVQLEQYYIDMITSLKLSNLFLRGHIQCHTNVQITGDSIIICREKIDKCLGDYKNVRKGVMEYLIVQLICCGLECRSNQLLTDNMSLSSFSVNGSLDLMLNEYGSVLGSMFFTPIRQIPTSWNLFACTKSGKETERALCSIAYEVLSGTNEGSYSFKSLVYSIGIIISELRWGGNGTRGLITLKDVICKSYGPILGGIMSRGEDDTEMESWLRRALSFDPDERPDFIECLASCFKSNSYITREVFSRLLMLKIIIGLIGDKNSFVIPLIYHSYIRFLYGERFIMRCEIMYGLDYMVIESSMLSGLYESKKNYHEDRPRHINDIALELLMSVFDDNTGVLKIPWEKSEILLTAYIDLHNCFDDILLPLDMIKLDDAAHKKKRFDQRSTSINCNSYLINVLQNIMNYEANINSSEKHDASSCDSIKELNNSISPDADIILDNLVYTPDIKDRDISLNELDLHMSSMETIPLGISHERVNTSNSPELYDMVASNSNKLDICEYDDGHEYEIVSNAMDMDHLSTQDIVIQLKKSYDEISCDKNSIDTQTENRKIKPPRLLTGEFGLEICYSPDHTNEILLIRILNSLDFYYQESSKPMSIYKTDGHILNDQEYERSMHTYSSGKGIILAILSYSLDGRSLSQLLIPYIQSNYQTDRTLLLTLSELLIMTNTIECLTYLQSTVWKVFETIIDTILVEGSNTETNQLFRIFDTIWYSDNKRLLRSKSCQISELMRTTIPKRVMSIVSMRGLTLVDGPITMLTYMGYYASDEIYNEMLYYILDPSKSLNDEDADVDDKTIRFIQETLKFRRYHFSSVIDHTNIRRVLRICETYVHYLIPHIIDLISDIIIGMKSDDIETAVGILETYDCTMSLELVKNFRVYSKSDEIIRDRRLSRMTMTDQRSIVRHDIMLRYLNLNHYNTLAEMFGSRDLYYINGMGTEFRSEDFMKHVLRKTIGLDSKCKPYSIQISDGKLEVMLVEGKDNDYLIHHINDELEIIHTHSTKSILTSYTNQSNIDKFVVYVNNYNFYVVTDKMLYLIRFDDKKTPTLHTVINNIVECGNCEFHGPIIFYDLCFTYAIFGNGFIRRVDLLNKIDTAISIPLTFGLLVDAVYLPNRSLMFVLTQGGYIFIFDNKAMEIINIIKPVAQDNNGILHLIKPTGIQIVPNSDNDNMHNDYATALLKKQNIGKSAGERFDEIFLSNYSNSSNEQKGYPSIECGISRGTSILITSEHYTVTSSDKKLCGFSVAWYDVFSFKRNFSIISATDSTRPLFNTQLETMIATSDDTELRGGLSFCQEEIKKLIKNEGDGAMVYLLTAISLPKCIHTRMLRRALYCSTGEYALSCSFILKGSEGNREKRLKGCEISHLIETKSELKIKVCIMDNKPFNQQLKCDADKASCDISKMRHHRPMFPNSNDNFVFGKACCITYHDGLLNVYS